MKELIEKEKVIRYLRDEVPLGTFMKRTIANADGACWSICDGIANDIPTVDAIPFKWIPFKKQKPPMTDEYLITYPLGVGRERYVTVATWLSALEGWDGFRTESVIAWAEIPKPYGEEHE